MYRDLKTFERKRLKKEIKRDVIERKEKKKKHKSFWVNELNLNSYSLEYENVCEGDY